MRRTAGAASPSLLPLLFALSFPMGAALEAQSAMERSPEVQEFVAVDAPVIALTNVRVVDGHGTPAREGQTVLVKNGRISAVGPAGEIRIPGGAEVLDLSGHTVIPGIVGAHNHTDYAGAQGRLTLAFSAPRMYLGSGVTTIRTAGSLSPYSEINLKAAIENGEAPGPRMHITGPRLSEGLANYSPTGPEDARRVVRYWAEEGATWIKAHARIDRANLGAAIDEAHRQGIKFTGHLCSVTWDEAIDLGIDNMEHGIFVATDFVEDKEPDLCPSNQGESLIGLDIGGAEVQALIQKLIDHDVAVTSTLAVIEQMVPGRPVESRVLEAMAPEVREAYQGRIQGRDSRPEEDRASSLEMWSTVLSFEKAFADAGGLLAVGVDPTGNGGAIPGFGDQRNFELLIEAGFSPVEAIQVMTLNGAKLLDEDYRLGSIEVGKLADLVVIDGDPISEPAKIRNVTLVFKEGVGYDSPKLLASVKGMVGAR